ncbi:MAG: bifunctional methylenetetrahydrofolate dehydrogenase/methenyltetrahydrofolate cyclohydrolase FolD [Myxococcales bacterium]|jgi:methylenetetrahydrofolate dehydrogenase (NADP+)/methenyltetrahydrofolate cyclohydrolase|nr:bifunctional methylenetetrahydrofolate dehydrogenase/methenyltetrahydrofolate cyclohydrolase FolD [Myxococcales bacterium]
MTARLLDGKKLAETLRADVKARVAAFVAERGRAPGLDVVLVGEDPASQVYTRNKEKASKEVGMNGRLHVLPADTSEAALLELVAKLDADDAVDGILVQLPLPKGTNEARILDAIDPAKDVDGFHPVNAGLLASGRDRALVPCTPRGCMKLLELAEIPLAGARAVVVGRSNIVGKPVAQLLLREHATVTVAHSRTKDLPAVCREADVLVAAVGRPEMIRGDWIKPGAVVIDVGINRVPAGEGKTKLVGDVAFEEAKERASAITPVPGGVGPMTIACLLENTLLAAIQRSRPRP